MRHSLITHNQHYAASSDESQRMAEEQVRRVQEQNRRARLQAVS